jgi:hypothetical protein
MTLTSNRYERLDPKMFAIGDIVDAHFAFKAFLPPEKDGRRQQRNFMFAIVLRSLALIEDKHSEVGNLISLPSTKDDIFI